jgi:chromosome segregation ATPase
MPLGLWKSRSEICREEMDRRHAERQKETDRRDAEWRTYCAKSDEQWAEWRAERAKADAEWRESHAELLNRMDENQRETMAAFKIVIEELRGLRREVHDLIDAVDANTEAILKLIDRFDEWEGRPPGSGRLGPRSA